MFEMTRDGCYEARRYLVANDKYQEFMDNRTSLDGYSLVQWANSVLEKEQHGDSLVASP